MRLKVSPKVAIDKIDALVREGADMVVWLEETYDQIGEAAEAEREARKLARAQRAKEVEESTPFGHLLAPSLHTSDLLAEHFDTGTRAATEGSKNLKASFDDWVIRTRDALKEIYNDFTPVYAFINAVGTGMTTPTLDTLFRDYLFMKREMEAKIDKLITFYDALVNNVRSPISYLPNEAKLCFYDFVCPLKADSNEAALCAFMFQHSIGEKVEMIDAYNHMYGEQSVTLGAPEKDKIKNAIDGINRKTNKGFGFPILSKDTTTISLTLPVRVTENML